MRYDSDELKHDSQADWVKPLSRGKIAALGARGVLVSLFGVALLFLALISFVSMLMNFGASEKPPAFEAAEARAQFQSQEALENPKCAEAPGEGCPYPTLYECMLYYSFTAEGATIEDFVKDSEVGATLCRERYPEPFITTVYFQAGSPDAFFTEEPVFEGGEGTTASPVLGVFFLLISGLSLFFGGRTLFKGLELIRLHTYEKNKLDIHLGS